MTKSVKTKVIETDQTSAGLRETLFYTLDGVVNGTVSAAQANAVARTSDQIIRTVELELEVQRHANKFGNSPKALDVLSTPLILGSS